MKTSFTYYYVQAQGKNNLPEIIYHSHNENKTEYYHKFLDRKKAIDLLESEKKSSPQTKFRIIKCVENYNVDEWN